jgi:hypothetical protein
MNRPPPLHPASKRGFSLRGAVDGELKQSLSLLGQGRYYVPQIAA